MQLNTSVLWVTRVPAKVADEVPPESAMGSSRTPKPDLAALIRTLQELSGRMSGLKGQMLGVKFGRLMKLSRPPTAAEASSIMTSKERGESTPRKICLPVFLNSASRLWTDRVPSGTSVELTLLVTTQISSR